MSNAQSWEKEVTLQGLTFQLTPRSISVDLEEPEPEKFETIPQALFDMEAKKWYIRSLRSAVDAKKADDDDGKAKTGSEVVQFLKDHSDREDKVYCRRNTQSKSFRIYAKAEGKNSATNSSTADVEELRRQIEALKAQVAQTNGEGKSSAPPPHEKRPEHPDATKEVEEIVTVLNYTHATIQKGVTVMGAAPKAADGFDLETAAPARTVIKNAWALPHRPTLETMGFEVVKQVTSLKQAEFLDGDKVKQVYYKELAELICQKTGATLCKPFHHMVRMSDAVQRGTDATKAQGPANAVHCDYTCRSSLNMFDNMCPREMQKGRFLVINAWRNISDDHPIVDHHLAMCDSTTLVQPDDFVAWDIVQADGKTAESYRLDPGHVAQHQWYYYPNMMKDDVLLFNQYDSDTRSRVRYNFHTACNDPTAPKPPKFGRCSLELRCIAFFPDFPVNTIPAGVYSTDGAVKRAVNKIMMGIQNGDHWDEHSRNRMRRALYKPDGVKTIAKQRTDSYKVTRGDDLTQEQKDLVVDILLKEQNFEAVTKGIFPPSTQLPWEVGTIGIKHTFLKKTIDDGVGSFAQKKILICGGGKEGLKQWLIHVAKEASKHGHYDIKDADEEQQGKIVDVLVKDDEFAQHCLKIFAPPADTRAFYVALGTDNIRKHLSKQTFEDCNGGWGQKRIMRAGGGVEGLRKWMTEVVKNASEKGQYEMKGIDEEQQAQVLGNLMGDQVFVNHCLEAFAPPRDVKAYYVKLGIDNIGKWFFKKTVEENQGSWGQKRIEKHGGDAAALRKWLGEVCLNASEKGHYELEGIDADQQGKIVDGLMSDDKLVKHCLTVFAPPK